MTPAAAAPMASSPPFASLDPALVETRFGVFPAGPRDVVTFAGGLPGFEDCSRFVLLSSPLLHPLTCLHGLDTACPSFLAIDPRLVEPGYDVPIGEGDRKRLDLRSTDVPLWLVLVRLEGDAAFANLYAPVVINPRRMIGLQLLPADSRYAADHPLVMD